MYTGSMYCVGSCDYATFDAFAADEAELWTLDCPVCGGALTYAYASAEGSLPGEVTLGAPKVVMTRNYALLT